MKNLWWQTVGTGNYHLVMLHGWGLNAGIWYCIQEKLASQFTLHLVDLPGFGRSQSYGALSLDDMTQCVLERAPQKAIWLGWSMGGLIASQAALTHPERVQVLVTVASSPCFSAREKWPGIKPEILSDFQQQLNNDFHHALERFLILQTIGTKMSLQDSRIIKQIMLALPTPQLEVLKNSLEFLKTADLREALAVLRIPHLRFYGYLDSLVPHKIASLLDTLWPHSESIVIAKASHAPFISHSSEFCVLLTALIHNLD